MLNRKQAPQYKSVEQIYLPEVNSETLDNGIKVHLLDGCTQDVAKIDILVNTERGNLPNRLIPVFAAKMLNEGTTKHTAQQLAEKFDFYGAYFQSVSGKDNSYVSFLSLNKHLENTLPLFAEALSESTFPQSEFEIQRQRSLNAFFVNNEKTSYVARNVFMEQLFGNQHFYGIQPDKVHFQNIEQSEVFSYYKKHYQPVNYEVIVSGKVSDNLIGNLNKYLGKLPTTTHKAEQAVIPFESKSGFNFVKKNDAVQTSICMGQTSISRNHADFLGLNILLTVLGGYFGSRLMKNIREKKGYTYGIYANLVPLLQSGFIIISADVKKDFAKETIKEIEHEINKLKTELIDDDELSLVKNYLMGDMLQVLDGSIALSEAYKELLPFGMDFAYYKQRTQKILNITAKELQSLANKYLCVDKMAKVVVGNEEIS